MSVKRMSIIGASLVFVALTLSVFALSSITSPRANTPDAESQSSRERPLAEALPITLRQGGFIPGEITKPAGDYFISVSNLTDTSDLSLRLDRENGNRAHEANLSRRKPYWRQHVHLVPGTYVLSEANHPQWVCRITVTAR